ncbi:hypothetical protein MRGA423_07550 [Mycobacterium tuberculosis RGTB423]|nr:hypothetical protein MRGA423_07550 [Mycobacterium tuberculosis RGTB423]
MAVQCRVWLEIQWRGMLGADQARAGGPARIWREHSMAAMKPRTGDGPLEATKEGRGIVMRVPLEGWRSPGRRADTRRSRRTG